MASTALAAVLAFATLGRRGLWWDELLTLAGVQRPFGDLIHLLTHSEANMSAYYLAMNGWTRLGHGDAFVRIPSAAAFVATVPLVAVLGRRLLGRAEGAVAGLLFAISPFAVFHAQEARSHSVTMLLVVASTLFLERWWRTGRRRDLWFWAGMSALGAYAHLFALFVTAAHLLAVGVGPERRRRLRELAVPFAALLVALVPLAVMTARAPGPQWNNAGGATELLKVAPDLAGDRPLAVAFAVLIAVAVLLTVCRHLDRDTVARQALIALWFVVPPAGVLLLSPVKPLVVPRYFAVVVPAMVLLVARGIVALGRRGALLALALVAVLSIVKVSHVETADTTMGEGWPAAAHAIDQEARPSDVIAPVNSRLAYDRYSKAHLVDITLASHKRGESYERASVSPEQAAARIPPGTRLWVLIRVTDDVEVSKALLARYIPNGLSLQTVRHFGPAVELRLYAPTTGT